MSRSQNLRHNVINQVIDDMARGHLPSPLPSQSALAEMYNISRTTVRHMLNHLSECGVLTLVGNDHVITRSPEHDDGFACTTASMAEQNRIFEQAFYTMINQRQLRAGETFSELQLARAAGVSPVVVREYLLKFGRYDLIQSEKRGQWSMKALLSPLPRWLQAKMLLERHRTLRDSVGSDFRMFSLLDRDFHALLLSAADNIFFNQSLEIISVIFHFHYQWDERDLKQRNIIAIDEHMTILSALICRSDLDALLALRNHLNTAKQSMIRSIRQENE